MFYIFIFIQINYNSHRTILFSYNRTIYLFSDALTVAPEQYLAGQVKDNCDYIYLLFNVNRLRFTEMPWCSVTDFGYVILYFYQFYFLRAYSIILVFICLLNINYLPTLYLLFTFEKKTWRTGNLKVVHLKTDNKFTKQ